MPFVVYLAVVLLHLVLLGLGSPAASTTKALLMPALALAVALVLVLQTRRRAFGSGAVSPLAEDRRRGRRRRARLLVTLLGVGILASWLGDILLGASFVLGLLGFAVAHLAYVLAFNGPGAARRLPLWTLGYIAIFGAALALLWHDLGELRPLVIGYGVVLVATAMTSARVNAVAALGGGLFLASDLLLAFRLFSRGFTSAFPDPWQDLAIMLLYCVGQGLIALGLLRRLVGRGV